MRYSLIVFAALILVSHGHSAMAEDEQDRARRAVEAGEILPFRDIMARAEKTYGGQMVEAELETEHGQLVYEIKILTPDSRVIKVLYDARTGDLVPPKGEVRGP